MSWSRDNTKAQQMSGVMRWVDDRQYSIERNYANPSRTREYIGAAKDLAPWPFENCTEAAIRKLQETYACGTAFFSPQHATSCQVYRAVRLGDIILSAVFGFVLNTARNVFNTAVLRPLGIEPQQFYDTVLSAAGQMGRVARALWNRAQVIGQALFRAVEDGFKKWFNNIAEPILDWFMGPISFDPDLLKNITNLRSLNIGTITGFIADALGLSWDRIVQTATETALSILPSGAVAFLEAFLPVIQRGSWTELKDWVAERAGGRGDLIQNLFTRVFGDVVLGLLPRILVSLGSWILTLIPGPGWVAGVLRVIKAVFDVLAYLIRNRHVIQSTIESLVGTVRDVLNVATGRTELSDTWIGQQGTRIQGALAGGTQALLGVLSSLIGFQPILDWLHGVIGGIVNAVPNTIQAVVMAVLRPLQQLLRRKGLQNENIISGPVSGSPELYVRTSTRTGRTLQIWIKDGDDKRWVRLNDVDEDGRDDYRRALQKAQELLGLLQAAGRAGPDQRLVGIGRRGRRRGSAAQGKRDAQEKSQPIVRKEAQVRDKLRRLLGHVSIECNPAADTTARSSTLGTNLLKAGPDRDPTTGSQSKVSNQPQAHHIVAGTAGPDESREILAQFPVCIGINDAINGVWLPQTSGVGVPASTNHLGRVFHNQTLTPRYYNYVLQRLRPVRGNKANIESRLRQLRIELASGNSSW